MEWEEERREENEKEKEKEGEGGEEGGEEEETKFQIEKVNPISFSDYLLKLLTENGLFLLFIKKMINIQ